ncbi:MULTISPECIES: hypothetical protein [Aphanothece]|uniref:hypothetical protein n=1 Tax=Aphanothece TaxID=1121 RepID=UPI003985355C
MVAAIRADLADPAFLQLCQGHAEATGHQRWTLSLVKVLQDLQADLALRHLHYLTLQAAVAINGTCTGSSWCPTSEAYGCLPNPGCGERLATDHSQHRHRQG